MKIGICLVLCLAAGAAAAGERKPIDGEELKAILGALSTKLGTEPGLAGVKIAHEADHSEARLDEAVLAKITLVEKNGAKFARISNTDIPAFAHNNALSLLWLEPTRNTEENAAKILPGLRTFLVDAVKIVRSSAGVATSVSFEQACKGLLGKVAAELQLSAADFESAASAENVFSEFKHKIYLIWVSFELRDNKLVLTLRTSQARILAYFSTSPTPEEEASFLATLKADLPPGSRGPQATLGTLLAHARQLFSKQCSEQPTHEEQEGLAFRLGFADEGTDPPPRDQIKPLGCWLQSISVTAFLFKAFPYFEVIVRIKELPLIHEFFIRSDAEGAVRGKLDAFFAELATEYRLMAGKFGVPNPRTDGYTFDEVKEELAARSTAHSFQWTEFAPNRWRSADNLLQYSLVEDSDKMVAEMVRAPSKSSQNPRIQQTAVNLKDADQIEVFFEDFVKFFTAKI